MRMSGAHTEMATAISLGIKVAYVGKIERMCG